MALGNKRYLDQELMDLMIAALQPLECFYIYDQDVNRTIMGTLRAIYMPENNRFMMQAETEYYNFNYQMYDPTPENTFERACSGMMTYHVNPMSPFFKLRQPAYLELGNKPVSTNLVKALGQRTRIIHGVFQEVQNFQTVSRVNRDKLCFGIGCKMLEPDPLRITKFTYIRPEDIGLGTSNGQFLDIYMAREKLSNFEARNRFPMPLKRDYWEKKDIMGMHDQERQNYHRLNVPINVLRRHLYDMCRTRNNSKLLKYKVDQLFPEVSQSDLEKGRDKWADVWFTEDCVMYIGVKEYRPIITSMMAPPYTIRSLARGQGEKALPLGLQITELETIGLTCTERKFAPSWTVVDDVEKLGLSFQPHGVMIKENGMDNPFPNILDVPMTEFLEIKRYAQARYDRMFFIDVFEMVHKDRMTQDEVQIRDHDDLAKLVLYTCEDQFSDLNPTVLTINQHVHERKKKTRNKDPLAGEVLNAQYTSALAFANKTGMMKKLSQMLVTGEQVSKALADDTPVNDRLDYLGYFEHTIAETGEDTLLREEKDASRREQERIRAKQLAYQKAQAEALSGASDAMARASEAERGGRQTQNTVPQQTPQGRG